MMRRRTGPAKATAFITSSLILVLGVVVPMLEAGVVNGRVAFEATHSAQCQLPDHDHSICAQHGQQRWPTRSTTPPTTSVARVQRVAAPAVANPSLLSWQSQNASRAPPRI